MKHFIRTHATHRLEKVDAELQRAVKTPHDPDALHDLRVAVRRFSQCVRTFESFFDHVSVRKLHHRLHKLMQLCGAVRNCDVTQELLDAGAILDVPLRKQIQTQRQSAEKALIEYLGRWHGKWALKHWRKRLDVAAQRTGGGKSKQTPSEYAHRLLPSMAEEWFDAGDAAAGKASSYGAMHHFRLLGKRFRYTLELFEDAYGTDLKRHLKILSTVQDKLGAINDCVAALPLLQGHPKAEAALTRLLVIREANFRGYWARSLGRRRQIWVGWLGKEKSDGDLYPPARRGRAA